MPELPEVEYVARQLRESLVGCSIVAARVLWPRAIAGMAPEDFVARIVGRRVSGIGRRAKYLLITLDDGDVLVVHRRMSGNLVFAAPDNDDPYTRVELALDD